jgi:hypothetical protein
MAADMSLLQGEVNTNPEALDLDVEKLLELLLQSLLDEQKL